MKSSRLRILSIAAVLSLLFGLLGFQSSAFAAALSPTVSTTGTLYTGTNTASVSFSFVAQTNIPSGGGLYFNSEGLDVPGCQSYPATCGDISISATSADLSGAVVTTKYAWGGSYYQFIASVPNSVAAGETISITFPTSKLSIGATNAWFEVGTYSSPVNTGQITLNRLDVSAHVSVGAVNSPKTVTFTSNDGTNGTFTQVASSQTALTSNSFIRAGYVFDYWSDVNMPWITFQNGANYSFSSNMTLQANWIAVYAITYNSHGGSSVANGSFTSGGSIVSLASAPTRAGYSFAGWFLNSSGGTALSNGYTPTANVPLTLHAQWTATSRTVTFDANGGSGSMTAQTSGSAAVLTTNTITRAGYGFTGWNTAANGSGTAYAVDATHPFTSSETLYAQWRALPATPVAAVDIQVPVGSAIANAPVDLDVDGLKDQTGYTVTVFSTPQIIDQGTIWSGRLNTTVRIPSNLEAGWHRLVIEGTAADGTPWTEENFFKVSPGGILLATSEVVPAELAMTGSQAVPVFYGAGFLILLGFGFLAANVTLRRRNNK